MLMKIQHLIDDALEIAVVPSFTRIGYAIARPLFPLLKLLFPRQITTSERLGFTGRGEGIAVQAVVSVALED